MKIGRENGKGEKEEEEGGREMEGGRKVDGEEEW